MFERYVESARRIIHWAKCEADGFGSPEICTEHILLALLRDELLVSCVMEGISEREIREAITAHLPRGEPNPLPHDLPLSRNSRKALLLAAEEADRLADRQIRNGHILLGVLRLKGSYAAQLLRQRGLAVEKIRPQIATLAANDAAREEKKLRSLPVVPGAKEAPLDAELRRQIPETIRRVGKLLRQGKRRKALQVLDEFMAVPGQDRKLGLRLLGGFAAITASRVGDLEAVRRYCEELLADNPGDPMALYTLADNFAQHGETAKAREYAGKCYQLALARGDEVGRGLVELLETRFPEIKARS